MYIADLLDKMLIAARASSSPKTLQKLSKHRVSQVRSLVAKNPSTPKKAIMRLARDKSLSVRENVMSNPNYLQYRAEQDGACEPGVLLPLEWLQEMYPPTPNKFL